MTNCNQAENQHPERQVFFMNFVQQMFLLIYSSTQSVQSDDSIIFLWPLCFFSEEPEQDPQTS